MDCQQWCEYTVRILMKQNTTAQEIIYLSAEFILQSPRDKKYLGMSPVYSLHPQPPLGPCVTLLCLIYQTQCTLILAELGTTQHPWVHQLIQDPL